MPSIASPLGPNRALSIIATPEKARHWLGLRSQWRSFKSLEPGMRAIEFEENDATIHWLMTLFAEGKPIDVSENDADGSYRWYVWEQRSHPVRSDSTVLLVVTEDGIYWMMSIKPEKTGNTVLPALTTSLLSWDHVERFASAEQV